ncbi:MAG TPA: sulfurtransferase-like selenium metabolism protein YedF [bacterium]|nr:sulfurtransferase-like selenium metabolism protein YedF [bacterium]
MKEIDARGLACPQPVVLARRAVESGEKDILVLTDDASSADNVSRYARTAGLNVEINTEGDTQKIRITGERIQAGDAAATRPAEISNVAGKTVMITAQSIGRGSDELGEVLMKLMLNTLAENEKLPDKLILMNDGVKLACEGSEVIGAMNDISARGVELLVCGTCLKHFGLMDSLRAGRVSNAYDILNELLSGDILSWT